MDRENVIKGLKTCISPDKRCSDGCPYYIFHNNVSEFCFERLIKDAFAMLEEQEAKPPVHIHEEYPEHDWVRKENGDIDDFADFFHDVDYHNGPMCKRCYYSFCVHCDPDGWNKEPCIIDEYKCPKCGGYIREGLKYCSDCGQAVKWE